MKYSNALLSAAYFDKLTAKSQARQSLTENSKSNKPINIKKIN